MRCRYFNIIILLIFMTVSVSSAREPGDSITTFWPLSDYRRSEKVDYKTFHSMGPLLKYESKGEESEIAFRPLFYRAWDEGGTSLTEVLYPVFSWKKEPGNSAYQALHLLNYDFGKREKGSDNEFMLFPLLFYGRNEGHDNYFAFFPFGGKILGKFGRDEIRFALFPLYSKTKKKETVVRNYIWPVFSLTRGEKERGWKFWPFYGTARKEGFYRKSFWLWPVFFSEDLNLDTSSPLQKRVMFPFYLSERSPDRFSRTVLWPFFRYVNDNREDYTEWDAPWPLIKKTTGEGRNGIRVLPFYADERWKERRNRWFLWPIYNVEETVTQVFERRRKRVLYFLYSDLEESVIANESSPLKRVALWPLFTYERKKGVSHFYFLSLLEPFFPENESIQRNLSPLWRLYQAKWDAQGNAVSSFLWNLYWKERRGSDLAFEVFPFVSYSRESVGGGYVEYSFLKGFFRYHSGPEWRGIYLFYLPWGIRWGNSSDHSALQDQIETCSNE